MKRASQITQLRIAGMRVLEDVTLDLGGLTVLIGDNGTGKSSIVEALEILRLASQPTSLIRDVIHTKHGGFHALLRRGSQALRLGARIQEADGTKIDYDVELRSSGATAVVAKEGAFLVEDSNGLPSASYDRALSVQERLATVLPEDQLDLSALGDRHHLLARSRSAFQLVDVHVPFETRPLWQQQELDIRTSPRLPCVVETTRRLARYGNNLANAFQELRNRGGDVWQRVISRTRMGILDDVTDFRLTARRRGEVELEVVFGRDPDHPLPVEYLSEGQLSYLAMVALCELSTDSSMLAFDEPELHLHPGLLARVVFMLEELAKSVPVLLTTHSDRLLDCLEAPAKTVVLVDLDENGVTRLRRPNHEVLADWLQDYRGIGSLRAEGYTEHVFDDSPGERQG
jgi:predicted ATPase